MEDLNQFRGSRLYLDANVFIYAREFHRVFSPPARAIIEAVEQGKLRAVTSELTLTEVLVLPIQNRDRAAQRDYQNLLQNSAHLIIHPVSREVLLEAARLRATARLSLPDSIHAAAAKLSGCKGFVTNDEYFNQLPNLRVVLLSHLDCDAAKS